MHSRRVVAVRCAAAAGSGYVIGRRLVLTSAHVVPEVDGPVQVAELAGDTWHAGVVRWRGAPRGRDDAALVEIVSDDWSERTGASPRWGRVATTRPGIACQTWGFPDWAGTVGDRPEAWHPSGILNPGSAYVGDRYVIALTTAPPEPVGDGASPWGGLSGAAMFCGPLLTGVLAADKAGGQHAYLYAVPVYVILQDGSFRAALDRHGITAVTMEPVEVHDLGEYEPGTGGSVASLLRARAEVVAFRGRERQMSELLSWASRPGFATWLLYGPGGQGKTRVAHELCRRLTERRWATLWLSRAAPTPSLGTFADVAVPLLVVVDYAETRDSVQVAELLRAGARHEGETPLRVLLLARTAGRWWRDLKAMDRHVEAVLESAPVVELPQLEPDAAGRVEAYQQAVEDLSRVMAPIMAAVPGQERHDWGGIAERLIAAGGDPGRRATALTLHMTALADLLDAADPTTGAAMVVGADPVEGRLIDHERRLWRKSAGTWPAIAALDGPTLEDAVAVATLFGAADTDQADALLDVLRSLNGQPQDVRSSLRDWVASVYPPSERGPWGGLQPDRLAEWFVGDRLISNPGLVDPLIAAAQPGQLEQLLIVYTRAAGHPAVAGRLDQALTDLCVRHRGVLHRFVIEVSTYAEAPGPLLKALRRMADDPTVTFVELLDMAQWIPPVSHVLTPWAPDIFQRIVDEATSQLTAEDPAFVPAQVAAVYNILSAWRSQLGQHEAAAADARQAVTMRRAANDGSALTLRELAGSLNNLSVCLAELGQRQPALDAIEEARRIHHQLDALEPGANLADLAMADDNLANRLRDLGRHESALEASRRAVTAMRLLGQLDTERHLPGLATALNNLSIHLSDAGLHAQALDAIQDTVAAYRRLAADQPDVFRPNLAMALSNLANRMSRLGWPQEAAETAERAVLVYRRLADDRPLTFEPQLACALQNFAVHLHQVGRPDAAVLAGEEAVAVYRRLSTERPGAFRRELATALHNHAGQLAELGRYGAAAAAAGESVGIQRQFGTQEPGWSGDDLDAALEMLDWLRDAAVEPGVALS